MKTPNVTSLALISSILLCGCPAIMQGQPTLSAVTMYGSSANGTFNNVQTWTEDALCNQYDLFLYTNTFVAPGWLNSGNTFSNLVPNYRLSLGTNIIQFAGDGLFAVPFLGFNFYFDNDFTNNRISAVTTNGTPAGFSVVGPSVTTHGELCANPHGSGSLIYFGNGYQVTLVDLHASYPPTDLVGPHSLGSNGTSDTGGSFTLLVDLVDTQLYIEMSQVRLSWHSQSNVLYQLQYNSDLTTNTWTDFGGTIQGDGQLDFTNVPAGPSTGARQISYRITHVP